MQLYILDCSKLSLENTRYLSDWFSLVIVFARPNSYLDWNPALSIIIILCIEIYQFLLLYKHEIMINNMTIIIVSLASRYSVVIHHRFHDVH